MTEGTLDEAYIEQAIRDARRFQGAFTGTSGTLAAHTVRLIREREHLLKTIDALEAANRSMRELIEARQARRASEACRADERGQSNRAVDLPSDVPFDFVEQNRRFSFVPAVVEEQADPDPIQIGGTMTREQLDAAWAGIKQRREEMLARIRGEEPSMASVQSRPESGELAACATSDPIVEPAASPCRIIGLAGRAGVGKNTVASMIDGAVVLQLADPIYAGVSAMLGIHESLLRCRSLKEKPISGIGKSPRQLLQTLGTEWGRDSVGEDLWLRLLERRIASLKEGGAKIIVIADVRFDNEAEAIRGMSGGEVWHVRRPSLATDEDDHKSEAGVMLIPGTDSLIVNSGSLDDLRQKVSAAMTSAR